MGALSRRVVAQNVTGWLFAMPALCGFLLFYAWPSVRAIAISLTDWNLLQPPRFIGLSNYAAILEDENFWQACRVTVLYVLCNIPLQTALGLLLAVLMDRLARSIAVRATIVFPYLVSNVVAAMIWLWMLDPLLGIVNAGLEGLGFSRQQFLADAGTALLSVAGINIWRHAGFTALLFYAGLQTIPKHLYEAARLEGATEWRIFWKVTLPLLRPVLTFVLATSFIGSFQVFDAIVVATQGGPGHSTRALVLYIYENGFSFFKMGYASALSVMLLAFLIAFTLVQMRLLRSGSDAGA